MTALDGDIGTVDQAYFDDEAWGVRYLVVNTGSWMDKRQVLISPYSIKRLDADSCSVPVKLTRQQVRESPNIDTDKPVSRQHETRYIGYYGYPRYWGGAYLWGVGAYPAFAAMADAQRNDSEALAGNDQQTDNHTDDVHLRSTKEVRGYHIDTADGSIGHVSGFLFDDVSWAIRYLTVDIRNWWPGGKEVLLATRWIDLVEWAQSAVYIRLAREAIRNSPEYDGALPPSRHYEETLHQYYGKGGYWSDEVPDMEVFEKVGTREFSAILKLDASVILKEGSRELTAVTLNAALPALAEDRNGPAILESTISELLRALIREYARVT
ncbi:PRC-barrel domain containing protein [Paraburkholderia fungorum]|uniref:PRC-barrel domain containing protein n=1 Tax=Paraburkholderia fungorum TaxID=134537 RepID=UPI00402B994E